MDLKSKLWNIIFSIVFLALFFLSAIVIEKTGRLMTLSLFELTIITLATFRLIRLVVYDKVMIWFREIFDIKEPTGLFATLKDLTSCPWCFGVWAALLTFVLYFIVPYGNLLVLLLAISGVAASIQILMNLIGWNAEYKKIETQKLKK